MKTKIMLVGGFLGAGKTTMLWNVAAHFSKEGKKVGLITNDQASELVDTSFLQSTGGVVREVSGSCFCCNFHGFTDAIRYMCEQDIDIIVAEPVGSCTDLSATILQPLKEKFSDCLSVAPLSVMVDAHRLKDILAGETSGLHEDAAYIVRKQMEEADVLLINKTDLLEQREIGELVNQTRNTFPKKDVFAVSALQDQNIDAWLTYVKITEKSAQHLLREIDYDTYAKGEAILGWLNATVELEAKEGGQGWKQFLSSLLNKLGEQFDSQKHAVGHVKILIKEKNNFVVGNIVGKKDTMKIRGNSNRDSCVSMVLNARVEMSPVELEQSV